MTLPTQPQTRAGMPPRRARVLLGASAKVGKTTLFANWAPQTSLIVDTHHGTLLLEGEHYVQHVRDWPGFVRTVDEILRGNHRFHTIGLDLVGDLWRFADQYYGISVDGMRVPASAVNDYGRSSAKARSAFTGQLGRLLTAPVGVWFLTHLREKTDKEGQLVVYAPDMNKDVHGYVMGAVDFVWLAETKPSGQRIVHTQPTKQFEAGSRVPLPSPLPMDARAIATAMDRALNPQDYDENGYRRKAEPAPDVVPPTAEPDSQTAPPERKETVTSIGQSDLPVDEVWWTATQRMIKECTTGEELRAFLADELKITVPAKVASWKTLLGALPADKQAGLTLWLQERQDARNEMPWSGNEKADATAPETTT